MFEVGPMRGGARKLTQLDFLSENSSNLDPALCSNGQYFHNNTEGPERMIQLCQSNKNKTLFEYTEVNGIKCRFMCP